jgi:protein-ribulosamine 3-kinase
VSRLEAELRDALGIESAEQLPGGGVLDCYWVMVGGAQRFLKTGPAKYADLLGAEADGLRALRAAGARAPETFGSGAAGRKAYLLLEHLELEISGDFAALGRMLAHLHRTIGPRFGWERDNFIGPTPQQNGWSDDWRTFFVERRLKPQFELARANGFQLEWPSLSLLENHQPEPSLLHGDLWSGNAGFSDGQPVIFDPSVYYGDRECDLAMTELFGGFPADFYSSYRTEFPVDAGFERRKHLYNLYHLLNHLNIFGGSYLGQVNATLSLLR